MCFLQYGYLIKVVISFFVKDFSLCDPILKSCVCFGTIIYHTLKSRFKSQTGTNDRPYIIHGRVNEVSAFLVPDLLQQKTHQRCDLIG